ncbi:aminotransferase class I/II-fold pyridoxal phosphate-dependent enzyme [Kaustia mangrovi]|uniref:Aminotransferase class I/II-fold pyridoxal phosphate-dependent enzyme n=1 Tax=Kaustia mangrovi TaxID=2593653 RepID=A0A7S8C2B1_9HYPH|nr:aminotransferase class I/II-fold pyridoxal phosphate-dependent enzyme [Kaustia mangrovi]QPC42068.1 aminotransferase class I/II-fold pyridoxal phosphate-dependent enzyme [Kaustia mangrovi]
MANQDPRPGPRSRAAQAAHFIDKTTGAVVPPIHLATTFARDESYELMGDYVYQRYTSPTLELSEAVLAELDGGVDAMLFGSGMAGIVALMETVETGRHIVAPQVMYHGTLDWLRRISAKRGIGLDLFDPADPDSLKPLIRKGETAVVWLESPVNPTWEVIDIALAGEAAHAAGAILAVDSTCAPPVTTRPLELGADIVFHSATKYLNGHSDVSAGALVTWEKGPLWEELATIRKLMGSALGPFEAWLLLRGLKTLYLRFETISDNALKIARHFERHPKIEAVLYPGLESHASHEIAKRQMTDGFGGMLSLCINGGAEEARRVVTGLRLFVAATSLGGVESLAEHRKSVEGPESLVPDNLIRLSVGIEDANDLIEDLDRALEAI